MMKNPDKLINLNEFETLASQIMKRDLYDFYAGGSCDEVTLNENIEALQRLLIQPRVLVDVSQVQTKVSVLGRTLEYPIMIAPLAYQALAREDAEKSSARAAASAGLGYVLSTNSSLSLESVAESAPELRNRHLWFQLYIVKDREFTKSLILRAHSAGFTALCLTVDRPVWGRRERDLKTGFVLPSDLKSGNYPSGFAGSRNSSASMQVETALTWKDLAWLRSISPLPIVLKGILHPDDAQIAAKEGVEAIIVSNHGARNLDSTISTIEALGPIAEAVDGKLEILMDGGIRRGTDILKALALGARSVLIGRPVIWGLACDNEQGVTNVLNLLCEEFKIAMTLSGCPRIEDINKSILFKR